MLLSVRVPRTAVSDAPVFAGLDGCRGGWILASWQPAQHKLVLRTLTTMAELLALPQRPACIVVDMPRVLEKLAVVGGRRCDREARALLSSRRKSSIFSAPTLAALEAWRQGGGYRAALAAQRRTGLGAPGLSLQSFHLLKSIDDLQRFVALAGAPPCLEGHPELAFARQHRPANGELISKHKAFGQKQRQQILTALGLPWSAAWAARTRGARRGLQAGMGDALDACILAHVSHQHALGLAELCPRDGQPDVSAPAIYF